MLAANDTGTDPALTVAELHAEIERLNSIKRQLKTSLDEQLQIQDLAKTVRSSNETKTILEVLKKLVNRILPHPELGIFMFSYDDIQAIGDPSIGLRNAVHNLAEEGILDWAITETRPISVPDLVGPEDEQSSYSVLIVPLIVMNTAIGVLLIRAKQLEAELTAQQMDLLSFAASQAAMALENSRLMNQLDESRQHLQDLIDNAQDLILILDLEGRIKYSNLKTDSVILPEIKVIGRSFFDFLMNSQDSENLKKMLLDGKRGIFEIEISAGEKTGPRLVELSVGPVPRGHPSKGSALVIMRDLTEQRSMEEQLREAAKLKAIMLAAVTVNHEINNPLTAITGSLYLIRRELGDQITEGISDRLTLADENCQKIEMVARKLEEVEEIKLKKYLDNTDMLDINLHGKSLEEK
jgi:PAS domain S-box-containing protein